jgi:hypothetical protein
LLLHCVVILLPTKAQDELHAKLVMVMIELAKAKTLDAVGATGKRQKIISITNAKVSIKLW